MQIKINDRSTYAPIRYEATRPYAARMGNAFLTQSQRGRDARKAFLLELGGRVATMSSDTTPDFGHVLTFVDCKGVLL